MPKQIIGTSADLRNCCIDITVKRDLASREIAFFAGQKD